jgi:hypothetical protein
MTTIVRAISPKCPKGFEAKSSLSPAGVLRTCQETNDSTKNNVPLPIRDSLKQGEEEKGLHQSNF